MTGVQTCALPISIFAPQFKAFLKDACAVGRRRPDLADSTIGAHRRRLDRELDRLLDLKPTDVEGSHLRATIGNKLVGTGAVGGALTLAKNSTG